MENKNIPPQTRSFYEPANTGEDMVSYAPLSPGSVLTPDNPALNQELTQDTYIPDDGMLESDYIAQVKTQEADKPPSVEPSTPVRLGGSDSPINPIKGKMFSYVVGFAVVVFVLLIGGGVMIFDKTGKTVVKAPSADVPDQSISLEDVQTQDSLKTLQPKGADKKLIINGDLISTNSVAIYSGKNLGKMILGQLDQDQIYTLPNNSGVFCLDSNNCDYVANNNAVNSLGGARGILGIGGGLSIQGNTLVSSLGTTTSLNGVSGSITLGSGLSISGKTLTAVATSINGLTGAVTVQGSANRVQVSSSGNAITLTTPQDIAVSSSPTFQTITLAAAGTQNGNVICDISNNCGFAGGANAYIQGGNSFAATATLGTNDLNNLIFETNNIDRVTIDTTGNVGISAVSNGAKLYVPYLTGDVGQPSTGLFSQSALVVVGDGTNTNNGLIAIDGESYSGVGVQGVSSTGIGVLGYSNSNAGLINGAGVLGINMNAGSAAVSGMGGLWASGGGVGVYGYAVSSYAVEGQSTAGVSGFFQAASSCGLFGGCSDINTSPTLVSRQLGSLTANLFEAQNNGGNALFSVGYDGHTGIGNGNNAAIDDCTMFSSILAGATCNQVLNIQENISSFSKDYISGISNQIQLSPGNGSNITSTVHGINNLVVTAADTANYNIVRGDVTSVTHTGTGTISFGEAAHFAINNGSSGTILFAKGLQSDADNYGSGTIGSATGVDATSYNVNNGTIGTALGLSASVGNLGSGDISNVNGINVATGNQGSGSITNNYGIQIQSAVNSGGGTLSNNYGIYVNDQSGAGTINSYNIYSAGATSKNYFEGYILANTLGSADTVDYLCRNSADQIATCSVTAPGANFIQGGNSFGATATLGTNDAFALNFETNNITACTIFASDQTFSCPGTGLLSEHFGRGSDAGGAQSIALGVSAVSGGDYSVAIGTQAYSNGTSSVAIGIDSAASYLWGIAIGESALSSANNAIAIGSDAIAGSVGSIAYGVYANAINNYDIALGYQAVASNGTSIALGKSSVASGSNSISIGASANATGNNSILVGSGYAFGTGSVSLGYISEADDNYDIALGYSSLAHGGNTIAIGKQSSTQSDGGIAIGSSALSDNYDSIALGTRADAGGDSALALGNHASAGHDGSIALGSHATTTAAGQLVIGSSTSSISSVYIGNGVTSTTPTGVTLQASGGSGIDIAGADFALASGKATGNAASGKILFQTSTSGVSGATLQSLATVAQIYGSTLEIGSTGTPGAVERLRVNTPTTVDNAASSILSTGGSANKGLVIQGAALQTANLQEWQASTGSVLGSVGATGSVLFQNSADSTAALSVKSSSGVDVLSVDTSNSSTTLNGINSDAVLGPELVTSQAFNNATYWTTCNSGAGGWTGTATQTTHNAGNSNPCISTAANFTVTAGATYQVSFTVSGVTAGVSQLYTKIGNGNFAYSNDNGSYTVVLKATNTNGLQFTSDSPWSGTISNISVKRLTTAVNPVLKVQNSSGLTALEVRVNTDTTNSFVGLNAGMSNIDGAGNAAFGSDVLGLNTSGYSNTGVGSSALGLNSIGFSNTAVGYYALGNNTIGSNNTAMGSSALAGNITGIGNTALGESALATNQTGSGNTNIGTWAGYNNITGSFNTVIGANAGFQASQTDFNTTSNLSSQTIIGSFAQGYLSNSFILGGQGTDQVAGYGFGTGSPTNFMSVTPKAYNTGGVALSSGSGSVTGIGTTFTANMVGMEIFIASGDNGATVPYKGTITAFTDATHITVSPVATKTYSGRSYYILYPGLEVTTAGKVGVGTLSPLSQLQVVIPDGGSTKALVVNNATSTGNIAEFQDNGTAVLSIADGGATVFQNTTNTTSGFIVKDSGGSNNVFRVDTTNARVGIGTGTGAPAYNLDVLSAGADASTVAQFKNAGATSCTVQPGGTGFACSSDARLKTNVVTIGDASDVIKRLRGVNFNWIGNPNGEIQSGFIAQELEQILPSAVSTDSNGYKVANYTAIIPYLVGAAQQQDIRVTSLEQSHSNQQQQITNITNRITQIQQQNTYSQTQSSNFTDLNVSGVANTTNLVVTDSVSTKDLSVTGSATISTLSVSGSATIAQLILTGDAEFAGNVGLKGHVLGNNDTRGTVTVPAGQTEFTYSFVKPYSVGPNVVLTPRDTFAPGYRVTTDENGFTVYFESAAATDVTMNFQAQQ